MGFEGSYIWKLRKVYADTLLAPVITVVITNKQGQLFLGQRADNRKWANLGGYMEPGEKAEDCVHREAMEEFGLTLSNLQPFGFMSDPAHTTATYPDGTTHMIRLLFSATAENEPVINDDENLAVGWFTPQTMPNPLTPATPLILELHQKWLKTNATQVI